MLKSAVLNSKSGYNFGHNFSAPMRQELSKSDVRYWQEHVFKHVRQAKDRKYIDADWSVRIAHQGHREQFLLDTPNKFEAARKARHIYQQLVASGWGAILAEFKPKKKALFGKKSNPTVGEFLGELRALHASRIKTIEGYAIALRKITADIADIQSGGRGGRPDKHSLWRETVEAVRLSTLTPAKVQAWKEAFLVRAGTDPVKQRSARVSVNSFIRRARSLFAPAMIDTLSGMVLPDPLPFSGIKLEKRSMPKYRSSFDAKALVGAAQEELAITEPEQFKIFVLALMVGLRKNEIDKLQWTSFNWHEGTISIVPTKYFRTKSDESTRSVWVPTEMFEIFRGYRAKAAGQFVVESQVEPIMHKPYDHYRCSTLFEKLISWLRSKGVEGAKPLHALRKEFGSLIAAAYGIYAAKEMLGHADISTTAAHYLEAKGKPTIGLGNLLKKLPANVIALDSTAQQPSSVPEPAHSDNSAPQS
jgi:integrase